MRFLAALSSALLATVAVAFPTETTSLETRALTWNPSPAAQSLYKQYCSSAYKSAKRSSLLATRAQPAGSTAVGLGAFASAAAGQPTLWTGGLGTCVGVAVTGTAGTSGGVTRFLWHVLLAQTNAEFQNQFNQFQNAVRASGLRNMNAIMYTVETRPGIVPADTAEYARDVEPDYTNLANAIAGLTGTTTGRRYHAWNQIGEMTILSNNAINPYTA